MATSLLHIDRHVKYTNSVVQNKSLTLTHLNCVKVVMYNLGCVAWSDRVSVVCTMFAAQSFSIGEDLVSDTQKHSC